MNIRKSRRVGILDRYSKGTLAVVFAGGGVTLFVLMLCTLAPLLTSFGPLSITHKLLSAPDNINLWGTDTLGRDVFSRALYGGRFSILIALIAMGLSLGIGIPMGSASGYLGGFIDQTVVVIMDALYSFPVYITALLITIILSPSALNIAVAVGIAYIPRYFRIVRSITISIKERKFIEAERGVGVGGVRMVMRYILPYAFSSIIVVSSLGIADSILLVAGLGFLGLGIAPPTPEWGTDLRWGRDVFLMGNWWVVIFPGLMIFLSVVGFNLLGEGLNALLKERVMGRYAA